ncbi:hypothetical protein DL93DRAFT_1923051 [Clavulina sp. PMI_390]|nr:hypothetical protein DL93DRAFT_1923051 [Clavulina sp. PMI_390]
MSFVARSIRPIAARASIVTARPISSSSVRSKTVTESAKDTLNSVNMKVGKGLASAIETGEDLTKKTKDAVAGGTEEAKAKAEQGATTASQKGNQAAADARQKKDELLEKGKSH